MAVFVLVMFWGLLAGAIISQKPSALQHGYKVCIPQEIIHNFNIPPI